MIDTSVSLLQRVRNGSDTTSWKRFVDLYSPWIAAWARRAGIKPQDIDDVVQEVLSKLHGELPKFEYDRERGLFRSWLRTLTVNCMRVVWRSKKLITIGRNDDSDIGNGIEQLADPNSDLSQMWDREHDQFLAERLLALTEPEFEPGTWKAFLRVVQEEADPATVASELGMTRGAVYTAKCRVLQRLRDQLAGLVD
jgi:RNA polymerase sigma-70 factor (ECF subfamily)